MGSRVTGDSECLGSARSRTPMPGKGRQLTITRGSPAGLDPTLVRPVTQTVAPPRSISGMRSHWSPIRWPPRGAQAGPPCIHSGSTVSSLHPLCATGADSVTESTEWHHLEASTFPEEITLVSSRTEAPKGGHPLGLLCRRSTGYETACSQLHQTVHA